MNKAGHLIAFRKKKPEYFGDYYTLATKQAQYHYVAITRCSAFALSKSFLVNKIFKKFIGMEEELTIEAFYRYRKYFKQKVNKKRTNLLAEINARMRYTSITPSIISKPPQSKL